MLKEMAALGFEWVELSHGIRITLVPGILRGVEEGVIKVASCHNFCPLPTGINHAAPNLYVPSTKDARERDQWLRHSRKSVDFAAQVGARNLVLHLGSVEFFWSNPGRKLDAYAEAHPDGDLLQDAKYQKLLTAALAKLNARKTVYWQHVHASLNELLPYAGSKKIALGFENREKFEELPVDEDHPALVASLPPTALAGYWHDAGHAHLKEQLGLLKHREHLEKNAPRALGFHLHDVDKDGRDHQPLGAGKVDFEMISRFWRPEHELVLELSPRLSVEDVLLSKKRLEELVAARFGA